MIDVVYIIPLLILIYVMGSGRLEIDIENPSFTNVSGLYFHNTMFKEPPLFEGYKFVDFAGHVCQAKILTCILFPCVDDYIVHSKNGGVISVQAFKHHTMIMIFIH